MMSAMSAATMSAAKMHMAETVAAAMASSMAAATMTSSTMTAAMSSAAMTATAAPGHRAARECHRDDNERNSDEPPDHGSLSAPRRRHRGAGKTQRERKSSTPGLAATGRKPRQA
jgi:hypothetical protein